MLRRSKRELLAVDFGVNQTFIMTERQAQLPRTGVQALEKM